MLVVPAHSVLQLRAARARLPTQCRLCARRTVSRPRATYCLSCSPSASCSAASAHTIAPANSGPRLGRRGCCPLYLRDHARGHTAPWLLAPPPHLLLAMSTICWLVSLAQVCTPQMRPLARSAGSSLHQQEVSRGGADTGHL